MSGTLATLLVHEDKQAPKECQRKDRRSLGLRGLKSYHASPWMSFLRERLSFCLVWAVLSGLVSSQTHLILKDTMGGR